MNSNPSCERLLSPATVWVQRKPGAERLLSESIQPIQQQKDRERKERGRMSNSYGSILVSCQETRQGSTHQWQTRHERGSRLGRLTAAHYVSDYEDQIHKYQSCKKLVWDQNVSVGLQEKCTTRFKHQQTCMSELFCISWLLFIVWFWILLVLLDNWWLLTHKDISSTAGQVSVI